MPTLIGRLLIWQSHGIMGLGAGFTAAGILAVILLGVGCLTSAAPKTVVSTGCLYLAYLWLLWLWPRGHTRFDERDFDIVVVGYGAAGSATALEAVGRGLRVLIVERFGGGGATARSGGVYYAGGGTALQHKLGVKDSPENMFRYLKEEMNGAVPDDHLRAFAEGSRGDVEFLLKHGVAVGEVEPAYYGGEARLFQAHKTSHPPNGFSLYFSGSESAQPFASAADPAQRGHLAVGDGGMVGTGSVLFRGLQSACEREPNIVVRTQTAVRAIIKEDGRVVGVETVSFSSVPWVLMLLAEIAEALANCMKPPQLKILDAFAQFMIGLVESAYGTKQFVTARRGVVLCAGGFGANYSMVCKHCPQYKDCMSLGTLADDGSGINLGVSAGGSVTGLQYGSAWKFTYPPEAFLKSVQVGRHGTRLGNEDVYGARLTNNMVQDGGQAWLVMDQKAWDEARVDMATSKTFVIFQRMFGWLNLHVNRQKADNLASLAKKCRLPEEALRETIDKYNAMCDKGKDTDFGKAPKFLSPLREAPFYAIKFSNAQTMWFTPFLTLGGLQVEFNTGRLLDEGGEPIEGIYAAGRTAAGIPATSYVSGLSIADAVFAGRRAARHASGLESGLPDVSQSGSKRPREDS